VPGEADRWIPFAVERGLEQLRQTMTLLEPGAGLLLLGEVGLTSHIADVIRRAGVPARLGI
jgi:transcriptional regulatory protein LevR